MAEVLKQKKRKKVTSKEPIGVKTPKDVEVENRKEDARLLKKYISQLKRKGFDLNPDPVFLTLEEKEMNKYFANKKTVSQLQCLRAENTDIAEYFTMLINRRLPSCRSFIVFNRELSENSSPQGVREIIEKNVPLMKNEELRTIQRLSDSENKTYFLDLIEKREYLDVDSVIIVFASTTDAPSKD